MRNEPDCRKEQDACKLEPNDILETIIEVRNLNLFFARVDCLCSSTLLALNCHLDQHIKLLDRHLKKKKKEKTSKS